MKKLMIVSSISFYQQVNQIKDQLSGKFIVDIPDLAKEMGKRGDFDLGNYDWFFGKNKQKRVSEIIHSHLHKVINSDLVLVINETKHQQKGYIGGNVLMEMGVAFAHNKPTYLLHPVSKKLPYTSEIAAMNPVILNNDLELLI